MVVIEGYYTRPDKDNDITFYNNCNNNKKEIKKKGEYRSET
jgi:hypothetical protein